MTWTMPLGLMCPRNVLEAALLRNQGASLWHEPEMFRVVDDLPSADVMQRLVRSATDAGDSLSTIKEDLLSTILHRAYV